MHVTGSPRRCAIAVLTALVKPVASAKFITLAIETVVSPAAAAVRRLVIPLAPALAAAIVAVALPATPVARAAGARPAPEPARLPAPLGRVLRGHGLDGAGLSVYVRDVASGEVLLAHNPDTLRNPASAIKLLTTYAALSALTPGYRWRTEVHALGTLRGGTLDGDLLIKGYGDPYLVEEELRRLLATLRRRGLERITGDLLLDTSHFADAQQDPAAFDGQPLRAYNVPPAALVANFKVVRFHFEPAGNAVRIVPEPALANLRIENRLRLARGRCRGYQRGIAVSLSDDGASVRFSGEFPSGCRRYSLARTVLDHERYFYGLFAAQWRELGGTLEGGPGKASAPAAGRPFLVWQSQPLPVVITAINKHSNNLMTRQLLLTLGAERYGAPATVEKGRRAIREWLDESGLSMPGLVLDNGSGLSRDSRMTARQLGELLAHAWRSPYMPEFAASLSLLGTDGTLGRRHDESPLAGMAHLKTGRLDHVSAMAGYLQTRQGRRLIVVVLHNARDVHRGPGAALQDALLAWLHAKVAP